MANKYFKNFILCGEIDYYCLLCNESFQFFAEVEKHVRWETHRKSVKSQTRNPKFKKDVVYKIGDAFYCEICNCTASDIDTITTHLGEDSHKNNKGKPKTEADITSSKVKRDSGYVLVSDNIIENRDWNGIVAKHCVICDIEILSTINHINTVEHALNLIKAGIVVEKDKAYRKLPNDFFYCFVCKVPFPLSDLDNHWSSKEHRDKAVGIYRVTVCPSSSANEDKKQELNKRLIDSQRDYYQINLERGLAVCKNCRTTFDLEFKTMLNHQKTHKDGDTTEQPAPVITVECPSSSEDDPEEVIYQEVQDHGKRRAELSVYGKENYIQLHPGGGRGYCRICHTTLSGHIRLFKEHVKGARHRGFLELKGVKKIKDHTVPEVNYKPLTEYLDNLFYSRPVHCLWLNKTNCLDIQSIILVSDVEKNPHDKTTKCFICDVYYPQGKDKDYEHFKTEEHKKKFLASKVLLIKGEFIREIRPDIYHCGYCNKAYPFWELMDKHLQSLEHKRKKTDKDLVLRIAKEWFDDKIVLKTSKNPDVLYIQFIYIGIFDDLSEVQVP